MASIYQVIVPPYRRVESAAEVGTTMSDNVLEASTTIQFTDKYSVLTEHQYKSVCREIAPFERANLELNRNYGESA